MEPRNHVFEAAFSLKTTTLAQVFQLVKKKTWYFIPLVVGGTCTYNSQENTLLPLTHTESSGVVEAPGFPGRFLSHDDV